MRSRSFQLIFLNAAPPFINGNGEAVQEASKQKKKQDYNNCDFFFYARSKINAKTKAAARAYTRAPQRTYVASFTFPYLVVRRGNCSESVWQDHALLVNFFATVNLPRVYCNCSRRSILICNRIGPIWTQWAESNWKPLPNAGRKLNLPPDRHHPRPRAHHHGAMQWIQQRPWKRWHNK